MKRTAILSFISALLLGAALIPASAESFLPPNDMQIPVGSERARGMTETQFNGVLDSLEKIYRPIAAKVGKTLEIRRLWTDATVNASTSQMGNRIILNMYGGLARHEQVTMDGFALVVCHEMGHNFGGAPKSGWATIEGQADYYANLKCLRMVFADESAKGFTRTQETSDSTARKACKAAFSKPEDRDVCVRNTMAGKSVSYLFKSLHNSNVLPGYDTPDPSVVTTMSTIHPATQCRMDTYLAGSVCTQPVSAELSYNDLTAGTCTRAGGFKTGFRPLCWYKPPSNEVSLLGFDLRSIAPENAVQNGPAFSALNGGVYW